MSQISDYLENKIIDATLRGVSYTTPANVYMALYTSDPMDDNSGSELVAASYARTLTTFAAAVNGLTSNSNEVLFPAATTDWGTVTHIGIMDASTGGNLLYHAPLTYPKIILNGDLFRVSIGNITIQVS